MKKEKLVFETPIYQKFQLKVWYLKQPNEGDALAELFYEDKGVKKFLYPAYKVWNLAAHFEDIIESEIKNNDRGYKIAGWTGFNSIMPKEI